VEKQKGGSCIVVRRAKKDLISRLNSYLISQPVSYGPMFCLYEPIVQDTGESFPACFPCPSTIVVLLFIYPGFHNWLIVHICFRIAFQTSFFAPENLANKKHQGNMTQYQQPSEPFPDEKLQTQGPIVQRENGTEEPTPSKHNGKTVTIADESDDSRRPSQRSSSSSDIEAGNTSEKKTRTRVPSWLCEIATYLHKEFEWVPQTFIWSNVKPAIRCALVAWVSLVLFVIPKVETVLGQASFLVLIGEYNLLSGST